MVSPSESTACDQNTVNATSVSLPLITYVNGSPRKAKKADATLAKYFIEVTETTSEKKGIFLKDDLFMHKWA